MIGSLPINLALSLVFGLGQIVVGGWLAVYPLARQRYLQWRQGLMMFVGLWFVVSGVVELVVSGMETSQRLTGAPGAVAFALWRGRADTALFVASALLACGVLAYLVMLRWRGSLGTAAHTEGLGAATTTELEGERGG